MTFQSSEIFIIDGKKIGVDAGLCPELPKNHPRILYSAKYGVASFCWREYIGTWEIKNGGLYLVDLGGNYTLKDGEPILAEWYTGEMVIEEQKENSIDYFLDCFEPLDEPRPRIVINKGKVVDISMVANRPIYPIPDADEIKNFVKRCGISSLIHFTTFDNVDGIINHGILGKKTIAKRGLYSVSNDPHRYDGVADAVCTSISFPNYKMFFKLQKNNREKDWAVLKLDPRILWEIPCAFCVTNAASSKVNKIPIEERKSFNSFAAMFEDRPPNIKRSDLGIPDNYPTDPQAEVLILEPVSPNYILDIFVKEEGKIHNKESIRSWQTIEDLPGLHHFKIRHDESLFKYRKDFEYWRNDQISDDNMPDF
ncbi:DUF4433 domain-containing protein [Suttonella sp. R2A3]|uniref:DarT ssDNA thymidine ADP-ribosyltransferase family protein n=1 Tax=Suttonella sp. R2A3 TaxID=2908648 RepID=UPI001F1F33F8|nr:DarT ssDNA thymidine ADP-ribosyltransferase family protein [Suttonella sp. R2A3]UJF24065.1 DUF4433 domain-containing protein [Suttonella sp. R2A3]